MPQANFTLQHISRWRVQSWSRVPSSSLLTLSYVSSSPFLTFSIVSSSILLTFSHVPSSSIPTFPHVPSSPQFTLLLLEGVLMLFVEEAGVSIVSSPHVSLECVVKEIYLALLSDYEHLSE